MDRFRPGRNFWYAHRGLKLRSRVPYPSLRLMGRRHGYPLLAHLLNLFQSMVDVNALFDLGDEVELVSQADERTVFIVAKTTHFG